MIGTEIAIILPNHPLVLHGKVFGVGINLPLQSGGIMMFFSVWSRYFHVNNNKGL